MIQPGWQILRFVRFATAKQNVSWLYKFTVDSLSGEHLDFIYMVNDLGNLPQIIQDLLHLTQRKQWVNVQLVEGSNRILMIKGIAEPKETQEELELKSKSERLKIQ